MVDGTGRTRLPVEDHASIADRLHHLRWSRVALAMAALVGIGLGDADPGSELLLAGGMFLLVLCVDLLARTRLERGLRLSTHLLVTSVLLEGMAIVTALYLAGGATSPVHYVVLIHGMTMALLLSRQLAIGSTVWVSLLLLASNEVQELGILPAVDQVDGNRLTVEPELVGLVLALWLATLLSVSARAINERVLQRQRFEQDVHASFGRAAEDARAPDETAQILVDHVLRSGAIEQAVVIDMREEPVVLARSGRGTARDVVLTAPPGSLLQDVATERTPAHARRLTRAPDTDLRQLLEDPTNVSAVPMVAGGEVLGVLLVVHGGQLGPRLQRTTVAKHQGLAGHAALALANAWAAEALDRHARTDRLTGVANRHTFDGHFDKELSRARREGSPLSLVLCDIDRFKRLNDEHGHQVGDRVLVEVAHTLERERRPYDLVARYGGEEFAIILTQAGHDEAMRVAERLRRAVEVAGCEFDVTTSFGVATTSDGVASRGELVATADSCLAEAKERGRNRVQGAEARPFGPAATGSQRAQ